MDSQSVKVSKQLICMRDVKTNASDRLEQAHEGIKHLETEEHNLEESLIRINATIAELE